MTRRLALPVIVATALIGAAAANSARPHKLPRTASARAAIVATNALGLKLLPRLGGNGNLVFSPYSIQSALAMLDQGAAGSTATQIDKVLGGQNASALAPANGALGTKLNDAVSVPPDDPAKEPKLLTADALWVQSGLPLEQPFQSALQEDFGAAPQVANFATDPETARQAINQWAAAHTGQLIKNLMPPGSITALTKLVLANAIYLKARWENPFVKSSTANAPFFTAPGQHVSVPFMTQLPFQALYGRGARYRAIELPYADSSLSMLAVMPAPGTLGTFERALTPGSLDRITGSLTQQQMQLEMPRLTLRLHTSLNETLAALGMPIAFSPLANFSGITHKVALQIEDVEHGAYMRVDEAGTVAAAATGISVYPLDASRPAAQLTLDHPFLLFLRDNANGAILFAGRVVNPAES